MKIKLNKTYTTIAAYALMVIAFGLLLGLVCFYIQPIANIIGRLLEKLSSVFFAVFFTICFAPVARFFERILLLLFKKRGKEHPLAISVFSAIIVIVLFLTIVTLVFANFFPAVVKGYESFQTSISPIVESIESRVYGSGSVFVVKLYESARNFFINLLSPDTGSLLTTFTSTITSIFSKTYDILLGLVLAVYFLVSRRYLTAVGNKLASAFLPEKFKSTTIAIFKRIYGFFMEFFSFRLTAGFFLAVTTYIVLRIFAVPYDIIIALVVFLAGFIPVFGPIAATLGCTLLIAIFTTTKGHLWQALLVLILLSGLQLVTTMFIEPFVLRKKLRPGPGGVIVCTIVSYAIFGFWGIPFAIPLYASVDVVYRELVARILTRKNLPINNDYYLTLKELPEGGEEISEENDGVDEGETPST